MTSIFTKILDGDIPGHFVWEDEQCFSIMTIEPIREGHLLVIPKLEVNHWDDMPAELAAHLMQIGQLIAKAIKVVVPCKRIGVSLVGLEVPHTHMHLIPIDQMGDLDFSKARTLPAEQLSAMADKLKRVLLDQGHAQANINRD